jgi:hypothetical protein
VSSQLFILLYEALFYDRKLVLLVDGLIELLDCNLVDILSLLQMLCRNVHFLLDLLQFFELVFELGLQKYALFGGHVSLGLKLLNLLSELGDPLVSVLLERLGLSDVEFEFSKLVDCLLVLLRCLLHPLVVLLILQLFLFQIQLHVLLI